jgi:DNA ligase 1
MSEYGHGKRAGILSDYTFAVKDSASKSSNDIVVSENEIPFFRNLKIIGKIYSGLSNKEMTIWQVS